MLFVPKKDSCELRFFCASASDEDLVGQVMLEKECFACLMERYDRKIKSYIRRIGRVSNETVEDIAQEVFIKVYANLHKFDRSMKFSSWIYRIAHNEAVNKFLYENRRRTENIMWDDNGEIKVDIKDTVDIGKEVEKGMMNEKLKEAMANVSEKYRKVIALNYLECKSYREIADELNKPVNTIGTMLNRGKKALKKELTSMGISYETVVA